MNQESEREATMSGEMDVFSMFVPVWGAIRAWCLTDWLAADFRRKLIGMILILVNVAETAACCRAIAFGVSHARFCGF